MKRIALVWLAFSLAGFSSGSLAGDQMAVAKLEVDLSFGTSSNLALALRFGTTYYIKELTDTQYASASLPVTGLSYSGNMGWRR